MNSLNFTNDLKPKPSSLSITLHLSFRSSSFFLSIDASSKESNSSEFDKSTFLLFCLVIPTWIKENWDFKVERYVLSFICVNFGIAKEPIIAISTIAIIISNKEKLLIFKTLLVYW